MAAAMDGSTKQGSGSSSQTPLFCTKCEVRLEQARGTTPTPFRARDLQQPGCDLCTFLLQVVTIFPEPVDIAATDSSFYLDINATGNYILRRANGGEMAFWLRSARGIPCPWGMFDRAEDLDIACPGSEEGLRKAFGWLRQCVADHDCGGLALKRPPTHVIDVGLSNDDVRLHQPGNINMRYMCLSHCWGNHVPLRTLKSNLQDHLRSIPWSAIPATFQDFINLARTLRVRHVWIDSLCIVQDDVEDWVRESADMAKIYEGSYLTVAATSAPDSSAGLYQLDQDQHMQYPITGTTIAGVPYWINARQAMSHPYFRGSHELSNTWPLIDRAWVFQERLLSPRMLHMSLTEMIWECREKTFCECGRIEPFGKLEHAPTSLSDGAENLCKEWHRIVENYSGLALSFEGDKMPALSGLAKSIAVQKSGARYLAGLWSDTLARDLLWFNDMGAFPRHSVTTRPTDWQAPSWSWASINGSVDYAGSRASLHRSDGCTVDVETRVAVKDAHVELATSDEMGRVKDGYVEVEGCVCEGEVCYAEQGGKIKSWGLQRKKPTASSTERERVRFYADVVTDPLFLGPDWHKMSQSVEVLCLRGAREHRSYTEVKEVDETEYTLILRCQDQARGIYKRVGMAIEERDLIEDPEAWKSQPSLFEDGWERRAITII